MKKDSSAPATKADLKNFATKQDFVRLQEVVDQKFATKTDLEITFERFFVRMEEHLERRMKHFAVEVMSHVDVRFEEWRSDFRLYPEVINDHGSRIRRLEAKAGVV